ncbi:MAG: dihydrolipoamide acetyltransferase family protein [Phycisphaerae bacterium]
MARKIAEEKGIDLALVRGTGPDGRIIKRDVLEAAARPQRVPPAASSPGLPTAPRPSGDVMVGSASPQLKAAKLEEKSIPLSSMRQTIARRLLASKQQLPHFYVAIDVLMDQLLALRQNANAQLAPEKLSVTDFLARAVAVALTRVPAVNASFTDTAILQHGSVDLGIAVALDDGLVVPVLRAAHTKGVRQISQEIKSLVELARSRKLKAQDMTGSTFTISNLGMYGIKDFTAIINPPESAILAVGGTSWQPVVNAQKQIVPAQVMTLTLSADHRVVDGAMGAQFLAELKKILENPLTMVI